MLGESGENLACDELRRQGYAILARRYRTRAGEIDIVARDGNALVFVEVKTRRSDDAGRPSDAIDQRKEQRMTQAALAYLKSNRLLGYSARFDVVAVTWPDDARKPTIEHFKNAFSPVGAGQFFS